MESTRSVRPLTPSAPYIGGKRNLAGRIVERIEAVPHTLYAEPFVGMGGVFLRRRQAARAEVINDYSRDVAGFFRVLQRTTFGGKVAGRTFGVDYARPARFDVTRLGPLLEEVHARLAGVVIECLPFDVFLRRYDRPGTLFYLDPPYWGCEGDYGRALFTRADFQRLAETLRGLTGARFILSLNDLPEVRATFAGFDVEEVDTTYSVGGGKAAKRVREVLISGGGKGC